VPNPTANKAALRQPASGSGGIEETKQSRYTFGKKYAHAQRLREKRERP